jgi:chitodextrinase
LAIPAAVTTATVNHDAPVSFGGEPGRVMARFTPSTTLVWEATGTPLAAFFDAISPDSGAPLSIELPHTNQAGFVNGAGNSVTNWYYSAKVWYFKDGQKIGLPSRDFQLPTGQNSVDLALVASGTAVTPPASAPTATVTSINGQTGDVVVAGLQAAQGVVFVTTGTEARPNGANLVFWVGGTTQPTNMASADLWFTTAPAPTGDITAPTTPTGVAASAVTSTSFTLNWSASTDAVGVVAYDVYLNGVLTASPVGTSVNLSGLTASTAYSVTVRARDAAGNPSTLSAALLVTTSAAAGDTTAPTVPTGLASSAITATSFTLNWTASTDAVGVTGYDVFLNSVLKTSTVGTTANITGLTGSTNYSVRVRAKDAAANVSAQSAALSVTTSAPTGDTIAPTVPTGLASSAITSSGFTLNWAASTDNVGVTGYDIYRSGTLHSSVGAVTTANITGLAASTNYSFTVMAKDAAGNVSSNSSPLSVTTSAPADTTPPSAPTGLSSSNIAATAFTLSWTAATDNVGVTGYDIFRNGTLHASVGAVTTANLTGFSASTGYSMTVKAKDAVGNVSAASSALSVTTGAVSGTPQHSVWGSAAFPYAIVKETGSPITVANHFYSYGTSPDVSAWRLVGAKVYIPSGQTVTGPLVLSAWKNTSLDGATVGTATITTPVAGQWNIGYFATPIETNAGDVMKVGYRFPNGDYFGLGNIQPETFIAALDGSHIVLSEIATPKRSSFKYDSGASTDSANSVYGIDVIYDEGP